jgi:3-methyladenine DNA glycosylase Mpg
VIGQGKGVGASVVETENFLGQKEEGQHGGGYEPAGFNQTQVVMMS